MSKTSQDKKIKDDDSCFFKFKKRDRAASEERLIQAGLEIFSKVGFASATTKMIAKKADVNESLIGRYFDGKEGLFLAIIKKFVEEMVHRALPYEPQASLQDELELYVQDRIDNGCEHEGFARIILSQALVDKKFKKAALETIPMQIDPHLIARVRKLFEEGKIKPESNVLEMCEEIDTYLDGVFFFGRIVHEDPVAELKKKTITFVRRYAQLFERV